MIERLAIFNRTRSHRFTLWREWSEQPDLLQSKEAAPQRPSSSFVNFICLNPSTATETEDDPTLTRLIGFAKDWGYFALCVTNLFAWRDADPKGLRTALEPVGDVNNMWLQSIALKADQVVCGWGNNDALYKRSAAVVAMLQHSGVKLSCFEISEMGEPKHPLYLKSALKPIPFGSRKAAA